MTDPPAEAPTQKRRRWRGVTLTVAVVALAGSAVLSMLAATLVTTVDSNVLDTDQFVELVGPLVDDPAVRGALSDRLTEQTLDALALEERIPARLAEIGPRLVLLAPPIVAATQGFVERAVDTAIDSDEFATVWNEALRLGHTRAIALLEEDEASLGNLGIDEGGVTLDLLGVVIIVIRRVVAGIGELIGANVELPEPVSNEDRRQAIDQLATVFGVTLPPDYGLVTVMSSEELDMAQRFYRFVQRLGPALIAAALLTGAAAILLAADRRRIIVWIGLSVAVVAVATRFALSIGVDRVAENARDPQSQEAARTVVDTLLGPFSAALWWLAALGLVTALVAYLSGPASILRRRSGRVATVPGAE
jgi:hypothetical protein